jgi:hypothetical protein
MGVELGSDQFRIYDKKGIRKLLWILKNG